MNRSAYDSLQDMLQARAFPSKCRRFNSLSIRRVFSTQSKPIISDRSATDAGDQLRAPVAAVKTPTLIYLSPFKDTLRRLKYLSWTSCVAAVSAAPILYALDGGAAVGMKLGAISLVLATGLGSTALLSVVMKPYVTRIGLNRRLDELFEEGSDGKIRIVPEVARETHVEIETLSLLAQPVRRQFKLDQLEASRSKMPFTSWQTVDTKPKRSYFYIHPDLFQGALSKHLLKLIERPKSKDC